MNTQSRTPVIKLMRSEPGYVTISAAVSWPASDCGGSFDVESTGRLVICSCLEELKKLGLKENAVIRTRIRMTDPASWPILAAIRHELLARSRAISTFQVDCEDSENDHLIAEFDMAPVAA